MRGVARSSKARISTFTPSVRGATTGGAAGTPEDAPAAGTPAAGAPAAGAPAKGSGEAGRGRLAASRSRCVLLRGVLLLGVLRDACAAAGGAEATDNPAAPTGKAQGTRARASCAVFRPPRKPSLRRNLRTQKKASRPAPEPEEHSAPEPGDNPGRAHRERKRVLSMLKSKCLSDSPGRSLLQVLAATSSSTWGALGRRASPQTALQQQSRRSAPGTHSAGGGLSTPRLTMCVFSCQGSRSSRQEPMPSGRRRCLTRLRRRICTALAAEVSQGQGQAALAGANTGVGFAYPFSARFLVAVGRDGTLKISGCALVVAALQQSERPCLVAPACVAPAADRLAARGDGVARTAGGSGAVGR